MNHGSDRADDDSPLLVPSTTATTVPRTTTTRSTSTTFDLSKLPAARSAARRPVRERADRAVREIQIPKIGLLQSDLRGHHADRHQPRSRSLARFGHAVSGRQHRVPGAPGHAQHPFLNLDLLSPGDQIMFHMPGRDCIYKVTGTQIVLPERSLRHRIPRDADGDAHRVQPQAQRRAAHRRQGQPRRRHPPPGLISTRRASVHTTEAGAHEQSGRVDHGCVGGHRRAVRARSWRSGVTTSCSSRAMRRGSTRSPRRSKARAATRAEVLAADLTDAAQLAHGRGRCVPRPVDIS